jgi:hypothetical protein
MAFGETSGGFCSAHCELDQTTQFGQDVLHPKVEDVKSQRVRNAETFVALCSANGKSSPILTTKFLSKMIFEETSGKVENIGEYSLWDHMDGLHYIDLEVSKSFVLITRNQVT